MNSFSRRRFVQVVSAAGAALALPKAVSAAAAAPHRVRVERSNGAVTASVLNDPASGALAIPCTMPMASGAALGGIGTAFIELRPDGSFYKWLIFNAGQWAGNLPASQAGVNPDMGP